MGWRDIANDIKTDMQDKDDRQGNALLRSAAVGSGWRRLWELVIASLDRNATELNQDLHDAKVLPYGNNLGLTRLHNNLYSFQNPVFPRIDLRITCVPGSEIVAIAERIYDPLEDSKQEITHSFHFTADDSLRPCFLGEKGSYLAPSQVADLLTDVVAAFFREAVNHPVARHHLQYEAST